MLFSQTRVPNFGFTAADPSAKLDPDWLITGSQCLMMRGEAEIESVAGFKVTKYGAANVANNGGDQSQSLGQGWATIGDDLNEGSGNIVEFIGRSLWFVGSGDITVYLPGLTANPTPLNNSSSFNFIPQIAVLNDTHTGYLAPFTVGLFAQDAPATLSIGAAGSMTGKVSVKLGWLRDATGAESLPSPASNVVNPSTQKVIIQFPAPINDVFPRDKWRVYATAPSFGETGPHLFFVDVPERRVSDESGTGYNIETGTFDVFTLNPTVTGYFTSEMIGKRLRFFDGTPTLLHTATITGVTTNTFVVKGVTYGDKVTFTPAYSGTLTSPAHNWNIDSFVSPSTRCIEYDWQGKDLLAITPPTDFFPPNTSARFIAAIGNVIVLVGTEEGNGIACSVPNFPEAFPPDFRFNLPEPPVGVLSRPQDGFFYVLCNNSIHEIRYAGFIDQDNVLSGSPTKAPLVPKTVSTNVGVAQQKAACQVGGDIYFMTKSKSPARIVRTGDSFTLDNSFGNRVELAMKGWDSSKVVVTYDETKHYIMYSYINTHFMYYPAFNVWTPPTFEDQLFSAGMDGAAVSSGFTLNGIIHLSGYKSEVNTTVDTTASSTTITGTFKETDAGKKISIPGAGPAAATLNTTIVSVAVNLLSAVIAVAASTNTTNASATITGFSLYTWDRDIFNVEFDGTCNWAARFAFGDYGVGTFPKTVHRVKVGGKLSVEEDYTVKFYRNYNVITAMGANRNLHAHGANVAVAENHIYHIVDCNNGEAELLSLHFEGFGDRCKIHFIEVSGEASGIDSNFLV